MNHSKTAMLSRALELKKVEDRHEKLLSVWTAYLSCLRNAIDLPVCCKIPNEPLSEREARWPLFEKTAYMRFTHDLNMGYIEYGIIDVGEDGREHLRPVVDYDFNTEGSFEGRLLTNDDIAKGAHTSAVFYVAQQAFATKTDFLRPDMP